MTQRIQRAIARRAGVCALVALAGNSSLTLSADSGSKAHVQHFEARLLPAVVVEGEDVVTTTLASKMRELHVPAVSVAFIHGGRVAWADAVGVADGSGRAVDTQTVFQAASISKPVTAVAAMSLVQAGTLQLDRDVNAFLSSWKLAESNTAERVTLRRLLTHTAGISVHGFGGYASGAPVPSLIQVLNGEKPANSLPIRVESIPGAAWNYSGGGYVIVQQLMSDVTKVPFAKLMKDRVLAPAGMHRSSFEQPVAAALEHNASIPFDSHGEPVPGGAHTYPEQSAAGLWTTPSDLARLAINLQSSLSGESGGVLNAATAHEMFKSVGMGSQGIGFLVGGTADHPWFMHGGSNEGFRCLLVAFNEGDGIVIMTNSDAGGEIARALVRTVAAEYGWPDFQPKHHRVVPMTAEALDRFAGRYRLGESATITVTRQGGQLIAQSSGENPEELTPEGPESFFSRKTEAQATFRLDPAGRVSGVSLSVGGNTYEAARIVATKEASAASGSQHASIGDFGFDMSGMDRTVRPGNDFNGFANGTWTRQAQVPADRASWGVWNVLEEKANEDMRQILEAAARSRAPKDSNSQKIGDYYGGFMDEATIEKRGVEPLKPQLDSIRSIQSYAALATALGHAIRVGDSTPISFQVNIDFNNPTVYSLYALQGGLGLPDRDYYLRDDEPVRAAQGAYLQYLAKLFRLSKLAADEAEAGERSRAVFDLERRLAQVQWTRVQQRNLAARYRPWGRSDYETRAPGFDWAAFFRAAGVLDQPMIVASTDSALVGTAAIVPTVPLSVWRDYLSMRAIDRHALYLGKSFVAAHFEFHETALAGTPVLPERWKRGVRFTERALGEAIGPLYVQKHFTAEARASAQQLVADLLSAAGKRIDALEWMSAVTKTRAREKLATFAVKIGYPEQWRDYSKLHIVSGRAYENALAADRFEYDRNIEKLGHAIDRNEWDMTPMTVNASYHPLQNEIVFPAAVLQPPFFDANADAAVNYGSIGTIIGHEISHGFDDQGRLFDARGAMTDWWTQEDAAKYRQRAAAFVAQYSAYEVLPGLHLNGELTLGENIADNAGIVIAYDAYRASLHGQTAPVIDGLSGDQRFFLAFAQGYRTIWREPSLRQQTTTNSHAPNSIRVRTVRNVTAWYDAFDVKPDETLFLAPADRVRIW